MAITVKFGGVEIGNITSVTPADLLAEDAIIDVASLVGSRSRTIAVSGFVKKAGLDKAVLLAEQKAFTEALAGKGPSTIEYPGCTPYTARLASIEWEDWTGGPIVRFTLTFKVQVENPFASAVKISPVEGSEPAKTLRPTLAPDRVRGPRVLKRVQVERFVDLARRDRLEEHGERCRGGPGPSGSARRLVAPWPS